MGTLLNKILEKAPEKSTHLRQPSKQSGVGVSQRSLITDEIVDEKSEVERIL